MSTPRRDRWCHHVEAAEAVIDCTGERHRVVWRRGKLILVDHDLAAEDAMMALGGEMPACVKALRLWRNLHTWAMGTEIFTQLQSRLGDDALLGPGELAAAHQLGLVLTWERAWRRGSYYTDHERLLATVLRAKAQGPLREHLRHWMKLHGSRRISGTAIEVARSAASADVTGDMDSVGVRATVALPARWLVEVWARGLPVVDGTFVLGVEPTSEATRLQVTAVAWEPHPTRSGHFGPVRMTATVDREPGGAWRLY